MTSMPQAVHAEETDAGGEVVLGVDTHAEEHVAAVITALGVLVASSAFAATAPGYRALVAWARGHGAVRRAGVEGTGSYGAALARHLRAAGVAVIEVNRPDRAARRRRGKTDAVDAEAAARAVLGGQAAVTPKTADGPVETLRLLKLAKDSAVKARTQAINQLKAVLVGADPELREAMTGLGRAALIRRCAELADPDTTDDDGVAATVAYTLRLLAHRVQHLSAEVNELAKRITHAIEAHAPQLLERRGVGPDSAAALLITAGDNPERLHTEASLAALCGASPIEASSGKTRRHRLNRGGDRQANAALHRIAITRLRCDQRTRDYVDRRTAEGKTRREALRCLKRYIAREIYNLIRPATTPAATTINTPSVAA
jgi:transposase